MMYIITVYKINLKVFANLSQVITIFIAKENTIILCIVREQK